MSTNYDEVAGNGNAARPSFISNSPLGVDLLEGQSQEQIAESVSLLIRTNRTENKLIGLDGAWGSGKSNLVKIIESKLRDTHHVFFYDAWGHQEDLQRRSFLEELTADLCDKGIINPDIWNQKLKDLLARKTETLTKTIPRISYGVLITFLIAIFTPIAKIIADNINVLSLKLLITSSPLLLGVVTWIIASIMARHALSLREVYYLYKDIDLVDKSSVTISEKEPSVMEFQKWIKELSESLTEKKLIVVFDNMDRLPPDKVRELWSSIHTFFAEDSFDGIWVIIPFDREHLIIAFDNNKEISDQFLIKSFSVIYRVAPPVLTDWQKFFDMKFKEAFGETEEKHQQIIRRSFDLLQDQITPRSIIAFINELVSLRLVVEDDIQLRYIAIFVLTKDDIQKDPVSQILNLEFLQKAAPLFREDQDLPNHIAALMYHVPLASASQVSLVREIQNSLHGGDGSRFNILANHIHFIDMLEQVIAGEDLDITSSVDTLAMLDDEHTEVEGVTTRITKIWDSLCEKELSTPLSEQKFTRTHELLLKNSSDTWRSALAKHFVHGVRNAEQFSGSAYYSSLFQLSSYIKDNDLSVDLMSFVTDIKKPADVFVTYVNEAGEDYKTFKLKCDESELHSFIDKKIPNELGGLDSISVVKDDYSFEPVIERLEKDLSTSVITAENIEPFYKLYKAITPDKPIKLLEDAVINSLLSTVMENSDAEFELLAMRLARTSEFPNDEGKAQTLLIGNDEKKVNRIAKRIEYYSTYGALLLNYPPWPQPLLKAVLRDLTLKSYGESRLEISSVLKQFKTLYTSLEISPEDFIERLKPWASYAKDNITTENITDIIIDYEFFEHAIGKEDELTRHIIDTMLEYLNSLTIEEWHGPLRDENSYLFNVTYWLLNGSELKTLPDNAVTEYKEILIQVAKDEIVMNREEAWDKIYETTNKNKLKATAKNIRDLYITERAITSEKFIKLAEFLLNHADLKQNSADVTRKILTPVAVDENCLRFIVDNAEFFALLINDAGDDADDFKDIIKQKVSSPECSIELRNFALEIGIENIVVPKNGEPGQEEN